MPMFSSEMLSQMIRFYGNALQGIMGNYMEQNVKAFLTIQNKLQEQAKQIYGDKMLLTPDLWKQFLQMQAPAMQGMLGNYLEQSAKLFMDMQQRMQDQTRGLFTAFPFPNFAAPGARAKTTISADSLPRPESGAQAALQRDVFPQRASRPCPMTRRSRNDAARRVRLARLPEGAGRLRADPHPAARRGLRGRAELRGRRSGRRQHLRLHRRRGGGVARRDRRGAGRERQGHRHRLPRRQGRRRVRAQSASARAGRHRPARHGGSHGRRARRSCRSRTIRSSTWCPPQGIKLTPKHYAYLKIAEGCNHRCTFCIIPSMRGDLVSRPLGEVMSEAENLLRAGVRELLVISQDTSAYGVDVKYRTGFWRGRPLKTRMTELARALGELAGEHGAWVRLHYVYPYPHVDEVLPLMAAGSVLPYLDVPFQHASPRILKLMKRPANAQDNLDRIRAWRSDLSRSHHPQDVHRRLSRRDRSRVRGAARVSRGGRARPRRLLRLFAGRRRGRQRAARSGAGGGEGRAARALHGAQAKISARRLAAKVGRTLERARRRGRGRAGDRAQRRRRAGDRRHRWDRRWRRARPRRVSSRCTVVGSSEHDLTAHRAA